MTVSRLLSATCLATLTATPVVSMEAEDFVEVILLPGWRMEDGRHMAGIRIEMAEGWHTYWRQPGDAGIPPVFNWTGSRNVVATGIVWPTPEIFDQDGYLTVGYQNSITLPLMVETKANAPAQLNGTIFLGVCKDVCIPVELDLSANLPTDTSQDQSIAESLALQPQMASALGLAQPGCSAAPISDGLSLTVMLSRAGRPNPDHLVIETGDPTIWSSTPKIDMGGSEISATTELVPAEAKPFALSRSEVIVTAFYGDEVIEYRGCTGR